MGALLRRYHEVKPVAKKEQAKTSVEKEETETKTKTDKKQAKKK